MNWFTGATAKGLEPRQLTNVTIHLSLPMIHTLDRVKRFLDCSIALGSQALVYVTEKVEGPFRTIPLLAESFGWLQDLRGSFTLR